MQFRSAVMLSVVVGALAFTVGRAWSQDAQPKQPSKEEMDKIWAEMSAPTEEHKKLGAMAGTWDCEMTMFEPGAEPKVEKGVSTVKPAINGLCMLSEHKSQMGGKPFEGFGVDGYSKERKQYYAFWTDSMGTTPMMLWGKPDADGKAITYDGDVYDCGPMGKMTPRTKIIHTDADHYTFEFWAKMEGAPDYMKFMEGKYTRRK